ncbi:hypothetical protein IJ103_04195 [Candidatus Saccharibacteria bacterium]|nr:hypothetical protein [Candidatus Saccharibacteria bacterium]
MPKAPYEKYLGPGARDVGCIINVRAHYDEDNRGEYRKYQAVWDTGSTRSAISSRVVAELAPPQVSETQVRGVNGDWHKCPVYYTDFEFPNGDSVSVETTRADFLGADILIGMDVIDKGNFCLTHRKGSQGLFFTFEII